MKIGVQLPEVEYEIAFGDLVAMARLAAEADARPGLDEGLDRLEDLAGRAAVRPGSRW